jgi:NADP-dependent alcohol dehydrogenase
MDIEHAATLAALAPAMLTVLKDRKRAKLLQYGERIWGITEGSEDERIDKAIAKTKEFFETME